MTKAALASLFLGSLLLCAVAPACAGSQKESKTAAAVPREEGIAETIALFKKKDSTIEQLFSTSAGYVVLPSVGEGAFIVGGGRGAGEAFEAGSYVGRVTVSEVSIGAQVGGQSYSEVVFFETPVDFKRLKENSFKFSAEILAVAADQGVAKNAKFKDGVATFVIPKQGLMASAAVGGQKLDFQPAQAQ